MLTFFRTNLISHSSQSTIWEKGGEGESLGTGRKSVRVTGFTRFYEGIKQRKTPSFLKTSQEVGLVFDC